MKIEPWLAYVIGAGLCWGTYVPLIAFGGKELKSRYLAFLCVGVAYFLIAVLFPVVRFALGVIFASAAGARPGAGAVMTPAEAVERCNVLLAHLWMVRTFLKHADEIQEDEELLDVPRTLYDSIRAVEPAYQCGDVAEYLRRLGGKLPK